jgi:hypothetical protein
MKIFDRATGQLITGEGRYFRNAGAALLQGLAAGKAAGWHGLKWLAGYMAMHFKALWAKIKNGWHWRAGKRPAPDIDLSGATAAELAAAAETDDAMMNAVFNGVVREIERRRAELDRREAALSAREAAAVGLCPA